MSSNEFILCLKSVRDCSVEKSHEYLTDFLRRINELADTIREEYLEVV